MKMHWPRGTEATLEDICACVGPGWKDILTKLVTDLEAMGWDGTIHQVKEKFGGLRFYIGLDTDEIFDRINQAEAESFKVCETCGKPGEPTSNHGWIKTLCSKCGNKTQH